MSASSTRLPTKRSRRFKAKAGAGLLLDVDNGEVLALASFPDFDTNGREVTQRENFEGRPDQLAVV